MSDVAQQLRAAADLAERAAVHRQHAELTGPRGDPTFIGAMDFIGDALRAAAAAEPNSPPPYGRRAYVESAWMFGIQVLTFVSVLLAVHDPARPWVLALTFAGALVLSKVVTDGLMEVWDRRTARKLAADSGAPELPAMLAELRASLEPHEGENAEIARRWLAHAERTLPAVRYRLCAKCFRTNGGLIYTRHPQVHVSAHGKQSCVDERLAGIITSLWEVCETRSCCQDDDGVAYIVPTAATLDAAQEALARLGIEAEHMDGVLRFPLRG